MTLLCSLPGGNEPPEPPDRHLIAIQDERAHGRRVFHVLVEEVGRLVAVAIEFSSGYHRSLPAAPVRSGTAGRGEAHTARWRQLEKAGALRHGLRIATRNGRVESIGTAGSSG